MAGGFTRADFEGLPVGVARPSDMGEGWLDYEVQAPLGHNDLLRSKTLGDYIVFNARQNSEGYSWAWLVKPDVLAALKAEQAKQRDSALASGVVSQPAAPGSLGRDSGGASAPPPAAPVSAQTSPPTEQINVEETNEASDDADSD